jgi:serine phosphatase RsbU (regulator of sigma subunit)
MTDEVPRHVPPDGQARFLPSLRARLLLSVNGVLAAVTMIALFLDYQNGLRWQIRQKQAALAEEARTILYAVQHFRKPRLREAGEYIDAVCASMRQDQSPGHHIALRIDGQTLQALAHGRASPEMLSALETAAAPDNQAQLAGETLVVGQAEQAGEVVYVAVYLSAVRRAVRGAVLWRLAAVACLAGLTTGIVNLLLLRLVARPVGRLVGALRLIGEGRLGLQTQAYTTSELASLSEAINAMSRALAESERERSAQRAKARRVQEHLLPDLSAIQGAQVVYAYHPAEDVGGDYFDITQRPDQTLVFCIADVTGHGIAAALEAAVLKAFFLEAVEQDPAPARILEHLNGRFSAIVLPGDFATILVGRWILGSGRLEYASAGHEPAYLVRSSGNADILGATGLPLGAVPNPTWEARVIPTGSGDRLFLLTDGLPEARAPNGEMFGRQRVADLLAGRSAGLVADQMTEVERAIIAYRAGQPATDDITVVAIELSGGSHVSQAASAVS